MIYPSLEQIINDQAMIVQYTGGNPGIKDRKLLESAYYNPLQTLGRGIISNDRRKICCSLLWVRSESFFLGWK